jgi:hypothetical protein
MNEQDLREDQDLPSTRELWELREPTKDAPDVGLNWLVRNTPVLRGRNGKPHLKAIAEAAGISTAALYAVVPERKGSQDYRAPGERAIGCLGFLGARINNVTPKHAHAMLFCLPETPSAVAELDARLAELEARASSTDRVAA